MKKIKRTICGSFLTAALLIHPAVYAEQDEFELEEVVVTAAKINEKIVLSGNATVVTREEIEQKNYSSVKEALRQVPGATVLSSGYHATAASISYSADTVRLNGDDRVVVLVDGRRVGSDGQGTGTGRGTAFLDQLVNIDNVERIEVVKGAGTALYGNGAVGGVINIVTRKGAANKTTVDIASGSWGYGNYKIAHSDQEKDISYIVTAGKSQSNDTSYRDASLDKVVTFKNTKYDDKYATLRIDKKFDDNRSLTVNFSHLNQNDRFPIAAIDYTSQTPWRGPNNDSFVKEAQERGNYVETIANDVEVTYNFNGKDGANNFFRVYKTHGNSRETGYNDDAWAYDDISTVLGSELRLGKKINDKNTITYGMEWRKNDYISDDIDYGNARVYAKYGSTYFGVFAQDTVQVAEKWALAPALRYSRYGNSKTNGEKTNNAVQRTTASLFANYDADKRTNMYASWQQLFNTPFYKDYSMTPGIQPEKGESYTVGVNHKINEKTTVRTSYFTAGMENAIVRYRDGGVTGAWKNRAYNVDQTKKAFEIQVEHQLNKDWSIEASYAYNATDQDASNNPDDTSADANYKKIYPSNLYKLNLNYQQPKWDINIIGQFYTGCDTQAFTASSFLVWDVGLNYKFDKSKKAYLKVQNIGDKAYETKAMTDARRFGIGAFPMPSRNIVLGFTQSI